MFCIFIFQYLTGVNDKTYCSDLYLSPANRDYTPYEYWTTNLWLVPELVITTVDDYDTFNCYYYDLYYRNYDYREPAFWMLQLIQETDYYYSDVDKYVPRIPMPITLKRLIFKLEIITIARYESHEFGQLLLQSLKEEDWAIYDRYLKYCLDPLLIRLYASYVSENLYNQFVERNSTL